MNNSSYFRRISLLSAAFQEVSISIKYIFDATEKTVTMRYLQTIFVKYIMLKLLEKKQKKVTLGIT